MCPLNWEWLLPIFWGHLNEYFFSSKSNFLIILIYGQTSNILLTLNSSFTNQLIKWSFKNLYKPLIFLCLWKIKKQSQNQSYLTNSQTTKVNRKSTTDCFTDYKCGFSDQTNTFFFSLLYDLSKLKYICFRRRKSSVII